MWSSGPGKQLTEMKWFSWHPWWSLYYHVVASGVKSLHRAQQQAAKRPPTMGIAHQGLNLVGDTCLAGLWHLKIYTKIFGKTSRWQWINKLVFHGLKNPTFFIVVCSGNIYEAEGFYSTIKRNWRCVAMKIWDQLLVTSALNCLKLFQNELTWEKRVKGIKLCCEHFSMWDFLRHCNCIFQFVPSNKKKSYVFLYLY